MFRLIIAGLLFMSISYSSIAQDYMPLVQQGATWLLYYSDEYPDTDYAAYKIEEDTIVNGVSYNNLYFYELGSNIQSDYIIQSKRLAGMLRDDISDRKVYGIVMPGLWQGFDLTYCDSTWNLDLNKEVLLYDFNVTVGEEFPDCHIDASESEVPVFITSDTLVDRYGQIRRTIINENGLELMEGIGYEDGLFMYAHTWVHSGWGFGMIDYCLSQDMNCQLLSNTSEISFSDFDILYKHSLRHISVTSEHNILAIYLYDIYGRLILTSDKAIVNTSSINMEGLYVVQVLTEGNKQISQSIYLSGN